jgi:hypothetical protein
VLDLGYHYEPLDYIFAGASAEAALTFQPGTAVGWYRTSSDWYHAGHGLHIADQQTVTFEGRAEAPCSFVRCNTVQELDLTGGYGAGGITGWAWPDIADAPQLIARFTRFSVMPDSGHWRDDWGWLVVRASHCEIYNGWTAGYNAQHWYTNCLWERVATGMSTDWPDSRFTMRNCTSIGGALSPARSGDGESVPVIIRDCAFDDTSIQNTSGTVTSYDCNATLTSAQTRVLPAGAGDVVHN